VTSLPDDPWSSPPPVPSPVPGPIAPGPVIVQIGDLAVTSTVVHTPAGDIPLAGSTWQVSDYWHNEQKIPTWAIVAAVAGFCVLTVFSLLFLLAKETVLEGVVQVTVANGPFTYVARVPVFNHLMAQDVHNRVNYVRSMSMR